MELLLVVGSSMEPTLQPGDIVVCVEARSFRRGDIVVFESDMPGQVGAKRVIGVPGDRVVYRSDRRLLVNGRDTTRIDLGELPLDNEADLLREEVLFGRRFRIHEAYGWSRKPGGEEPSEGYFVMGDSRDLSRDSRDFGSIPASRIRCRVLGIVATELKRGFSLFRSKLFLE
jgi:signal peptidase I